MSKRKEDVAMTAGCVSILDNLTKTQNPEQPPPWFQQGAWHAGVRPALFAGLTILVAVLFISSLALAEGRNIAYQVNGEEFAGYYTSPAPSAPLVLLIHDWDGLTEYEVKRAEMLAGQGYAVFAADLFGAGIRPTEDKDKLQHTGELYKDRRKMRAVLDGAVQAAAAQGANISNAVAMGYCFGGAAVLEFARAGADVKGFVTFHGGLATPEGQDYAAVKGRVLIMHGTADSNITMQDFSALAVALEQQKIPHEMITYGGAPHGFTVFGARSYREDADRKSWQRFLDFLEETLRGKR
jgi:dienelactone hydrolase